MMLGPIIWIKEKHMYTRKGQKIIGLSVWTSVWPLFAIFGLICAIPETFDWIPNIPISKWYPGGALLVSLILMPVNYIAMKASADPDGRIKKEFFKKGDE